MEGFCRSCLIRYDELTDLLQYSEKNRRLFVYCTGLQVKRNDAIPFQICKYCFVSMKAACNFKKQCRASDKKLKSFLSLKDVGVGIDFCTFLKNNDDAMAFRLPLVSGSSTPANYNKAKDDDNESTCTSIRNFMTDILQGEEVPDTEARIIREVIEEETDLLDDTLDSHWLRDEDSVDMDFRLDLNFSPFATPHSIDNDHCYTPKRLVDARENPSPIKKYFTSISPARNHREINDFTNIIANNLSEKELCVNGINNANSNKNEKSDINSTIANLKSINNMNLAKVKKKHNEFELNITETDDAIRDLNLPVIDDGKSVIGLDISIDSDQLMNSLNLPIYDAEISVNNTELPSFDSMPSIPSIDNESMHNLDLKVIEDMKNKGNYKYSSASKEIEKIVLDEMNTKKICQEKPCSIDRNLEKALRNEKAKEYFLDDLLVSPRVNSGASTPTIRNILFGEKDNQNQNGISKALALLQVPSISPKTSTLQTNLQEKTNIINIKSEIDERDEYKLANGLDEVDSVINNMQTDNYSPYDERQFDLENCYCNLCKKKYKSVKALSIHSAKTHKLKIIKPKAHIYKPRICPYCGKESRNLQNYHRHLKIHERKPDLGKYQCDHCSLVFTSKFKLTCHIISLDPKLAKKKPGKYVCTICGSTTSALGNFRLHQRRHQKIYAYKCSECGKGFYRPSELAIHMRFHTGERPFPCVYCDKRFSRKDALTKHVKIHVDDRRHECEYCAKKFTTSSQLKTHKKESIKCKRKREMAFELIPDKVSESDKTVAIKESKVLLEVKEVENVEASKGLLEVKGVENVEASKGLLEVKGVENVEASKRLLEVKGVENVEASKGLLEVKGVENVEASKGLLEVKGVENVEAIKSITIESNQELCTELPYIDTEMSN